MLDSICLRAFFSYTSLSDNTRPELLTAGTSFRAAPDMTSECVKVNLANGSPRPKHLATTATTTQVAHVNARCCCMSVV